MHSLAVPAFPIDPRRALLPSCRLLFSIELFFVPRPRPQHPPAPHVHFHNLVVPLPSTFPRLPFTPRPLLHLLPTTSLNCITQYPGFPQIFNSPPIILLHIDNFSFNTTKLEIKSSPWPPPRWITRTPTAIASMVCLRPYCVIALPYPALYPSRQHQTPPPAPHQTRLRMYELCGVLFATSASAYLTLPSACLPSTSLTYIIITPLARRDLTHLCLSTYGLSTSISHQQLTGSFQRTPLATTATVVRRRVAMTATIRRVVAPCLPTATTGKHRHQLACSGTHKTYKQ